MTAPPQASVSRARSRSGFTSRFARPSVDESQEEKNAEYRAVNERLGDVLLHAPYEVDHAEKRGEVGEPVESLPFHGAEALGHLRRRRDGERNEDEPRRETDG